MMNYTLLSLEIAVVLLGLGLLLLDLWAPARLRPKLGYAAAVALGLVFLFSFTGAVDLSGKATAFGGMYVLDHFALYFKRLLLVAGVMVLILAVEFSDRIRSGISEYYALIVFALAGMMLAASANDLALLFVSMELITVTFYVLNAFQRDRTTSLESGVKYLILGALASGLMVFGIALVFGATGTFDFAEMAEATPRLLGSRLFQVGVILVLAGMAFKIAVVPMHFWVPDVYQGAPIPTTAFLAIGSKAAGVVLLIRFLFAAVPDLAVKGTQLALFLACATILYGNLCALSQRSLKRLMGYSSIAHAGYLVLGLAAMSRAGVSAVLFYLGVYLFAVMAVFLVLCVTSRDTQDDDLDTLAGLMGRSPFLASVLTLALVSLAGIPPLAGFFGKFLIFKAVIEQGAHNAAYYWAAMIAIVGVVISLAYYLNIVRLIFWERSSEPPISTDSSGVMRAALWVCAAGVLLLGVAPGFLLGVTDEVLGMLSLR